MGLFSKRSKEAETRQCVHNNLDARWSSMDEVGKTDRVDHYVCRQCGVEMSREEFETRD